MNQQTIDEIIELSKLNYTIVQISEKVSLPYNEVSKILIENNTNSMLGLKANISRQLKVIESGKTIDERKSQIEETKQLIDTIYDNFKWVIDNIKENCCEYYDVNTFDVTVKKPTEDEIVELLKQIKRDEMMVFVPFPTVSIIHYIIHINKIRKSTISKKLSKINSEVKKDNRKLIRLDIEEVINEMYMIYKWIVGELNSCIEVNDINKELEEENDI